MKCPSCGRKAAKQKTRYGLRHSCDFCKLWSWGGKPLVDKRTHEARKQAHMAFDTWWRSGRISRTAAYAMLAKELDMPPDMAHMAVMDAETAELVPTAVKRMRRQLREERTPVA